ncbi:MAG: biotin/lipoyl-containing protein [Pseudomonadota bacterium]
MPSEVKMPQLGMNQDSAVIVSWLKAAGEKVAAGEAIFEVETDKATVEVEAAADGFLAGIRAPEGADVPVGDVIAMIVDREAEVGEHESAAAAPAAPAEAPPPPPAPVPSPAPEPNEAEVAAPLKTVPPAIAAGRILASPLAKRVASEQGIDLAALRASGVSEPIHAGDLARAHAGGLSILSARVEGGALAALLERSEGASRTALFAAFAASAWRAAVEDAAVSIAIRGLDGSITPYPADAGADAALSLIDLCDTRLDSFAPAGGTPALAAAREGDAFLLTLSFNEDRLPFPTAAALLDAIAARVENPIRQLL